MLVGIGRFEWTRTLLSKLCECADVIAGRERFIAAASEQYDAKVCRTSRQDESVAKGGRDGRGERVPLRRPVERDRQDRPVLRDPETRNVRVGHELARGFGGLWLIGADDLERALELFLVALLANEEANSCIGKSNGFSQRQTERFNLENCSLKSGEVVLVHRAIIWECERKDGVLIDPCSVRFRYTLTTNGTTLDSVEDELRVGHPGAHI